MCRAAINFFSIVFCNVLIFTISFSSRIFCRVNADSAILKKIIFARFSGDEKQCSIDTLLLNSNLWTASVYECKTLKVIL